MNEKSDQGTITALLQLFENSHYPRALRVKERLENGEALSDENMRFLQDALERVQQAVPIVKRNEQYQKLVGQVISFYSGIADLAVKNEPGLTEK